MTDENGKEQKEPANPAAWITELDSQALAGMISVLARQYSDEAGRRPDTVKVKLPGALVRMAEHLTTFLAKSGQAYIGTPIDLLVQSVLVYSGLIMTERLAKGKLTVGADDPAGLVTMIEGLAAEVAKKGKNLPPAEFAELLRTTLAEIGVDPSRVEVCVEENGKVNCSRCKYDPDTCPIKQAASDQARTGGGRVQVIAVRSDAFGKRAEKEASEDTDLPTAPADRPGAS